MKRILVTRPRQQADGFLEGLKTAGFDPICFPVIEIRPIDANPQLDEALKQLDKYAWIVFTSVNGVQAVFEGLPAGAQLPRVAAIGPKTAQALETRGVRVDFVPEEYVAESVLPGLGNLQGKRVLLTRAEIARRALPEAIIQAGGLADEIAVYRTLPTQPEPAGLEALKSGVAWITFTSPSTVHNFAELIRQQHMDPLHLAGEPRIACIGPITQQAAVEAGFHVDLVAQTYTTEGLIDALLNA